MFIVILTLKVMISSVSKIDRFFAEHGGKDKKYLCASEVEPVTMKVITLILHADQYEGILLSYTQINMREYSYPTRRSI